MIIKIEDKSYSFKYNIEEITLSDYLDIVDILNEDQYDTYIDQHTNKEINRKEPRPKNERDDTFVFNTYRMVIKRLSNIPVKYLNEDEVVTTLLNHLIPVFEAVNDIQSTIDLTNEDFPSFNIDSKVLEFDAIENWSFYKWVTLETFMSRGLSEKIEGDDGELTTKVIIKGDRYILPILYGTWNDKLTDLDAKMEYFNTTESFINTYAVYIRALHLINTVKKLHNFIYNSEGGSISNSPNLDGHNRDFGWLSTLSDLAEKGVFGCYTDVKNANLLQVLEYLNCSCSKNAAEANDASLKHNK